MTSLAFVSFLAGIFTILAPCVLPVLPIILAGSMGEKNTWYPYIVTLSLALSIVLFTVLLKVSTIFLGVPSSTWTYVSGGIVLFLGLTYLFPHTWARVSNIFGSSKLQQNLNNTSGVTWSFLRAILTGMALGPVFSSCSPTYTLLLSTVFPASMALGLFYTFLYALGLSIMLLLIAKWGQRLVKWIRPFADEKWLFRKALGGILVVVALLIITGTDKALETKLLNNNFCATEWVEQGVLKSFSWFWH